MKYLITGGAGFIGSACARALMQRGDEVVLTDNFNDYYDVQLKRDRVAVFLGEYKDAFVLHEGDIRDQNFMEDVFTQHKPDKVLHLAAMAGVRASLENPSLYADVNVVGTTNMLSLSVRYNVKNFVYASSSSVYGANAKVPFSESDPTEHPVSPYAATKKATELLAHTFSSVHGLHTTGLRFFTVYGPWGRPDMGVFLFPEKIMRGEVIDVFGQGKMQRNFTYIDDIVTGVITVLDADLENDVMNIGGDATVALMDFIGEVERAVGNTCEKNMLPMQPGDVVRTDADISKLRALGWSPETDITKGLEEFVRWYKEYYDNK